MTFPKKMVDFSEKRLMIQNVIDRINEHGNNYMENLEAFNEQFQLSQTSKNIHQDAKRKNAGNGPSPS